MRMKEAVVILHNVRSTHNVGSIFRTADAAGVSKIYLSGYTPTPIDRFGRARKDIAKTALGAESLVLWEHVPDAHSAVSKLKDEGFRIVAIEQDERAEDYRVLQAREKTAFVFGEEVHGLPQSLLRECDVIAEIPMHGGKESLNVSVSAGIALFRILGR
jgi:23S rRNA (guanosine2251-2'-O)-methyltransferase